MQAPRLTTLLLAFVAVAGCKNTETKTVAPATPAAPPPGMAENQMPPLPAGHPPINPGNGQTGMQGAQMPAHQPAGGGIVWVLPKGWSEARGGGMRYATLKPPADGPVDVSVIVLGGLAGGELSNVNRWRSQIGLPAIDDLTREKARKALDSRAGEISLYDFTGQGEKKQRMLAGLLVSEGSTWFFKMTGEDRLVERLRDDFVTLLESLRPAGK